MFKSDEIILTNTGMLGDFFFCLPVASWLHQTFGIKIHWVLPIDFPPFHFIGPLLKYQPFTTNVSLVQHKIHWECGGQPYKFNPADYGILGEYYNLGFRHFPNRYISDFYAMEHGWSYDKDYRLSLGPDLEEGSEVLRSREALMKIMVPTATPIPPREDLLTLARRLAMAKEVNAWFGGIAVLCHMIKKKFNCFFSAVNGDLDIRSMYIPDNELVVWHDAEKLMDWKSPWLQVSDP